MGNLRNGEDFTAPSNFGSFTGSFFVEEIMPEVAESEVPSSASCSADMNHFFASEKVFSVTSVNFYFIVDIS